MEPLVSVIIPNYNHAKYLNQRIDSVLSQTYSNFEVIILDDKSSDNSEQVIAGYKGHPKVTHIVINSENSGSTFLQWNKGLRLAKGEIIWIAESDDYCSNDFLSNCVAEYLKVPGCVVAYCSSEYVDANNNDLGTYNPYEKDLYQFHGLDFIKRRMAFGCAIWNASSAIFNKETALTIEKNYQTYKACGDKLFWILMAEQGNVVHINRIMNFFRQHLNKVSPKRLRDGTSLTEEYRIYNYQCEKGYLSDIRRVYVLNLYLEKIKRTPFDSEDIRTNLIKLWKFDNKFKRFAISSVAKIYTYYKLYFQKIQPLL